MSFFGNFNDFRGKQVVFLRDRWEKLVNKVDKGKNLERLGNSIERGTPFGNVEWQSITARKMKLESIMRPGGRPFK